jgi:transposase-like protein
MALLACPTTPLRVAMLAPISWRVRSRHYGPLPGRPTDPNTKWQSPARIRKINVTDPDSRTIKDGRRFVQGYNAQAAVTEDQIVVAAEVTNAARDSVVFATMVTATEQNLAGNGADPVEVLVADTGYWSIDNATLDIDADVLITPMPATGGITDPDDPRIARRRDVIERLDRSDLTIKAAAREMGVSTTTVRKLLRRHRSGRPDPVEVRRAMVERLATERGAAAYAKTQDHRRDGLRERQSQPRVPAILP